MKENKKVIISTIIAVTFLTILVVGATFAYFQTNNKVSGTTSVQATTKKIGSIVITKPIEHLYINLSAYEMQSSKSGTSYYATSDENKKYETSEQNHVLATATISGGEEDTIYACKLYTSVYIPSQILEGDMNLILNGNNISTINGYKIINDDLYTASSVYPNGRGIDYVISFKHTGNGTINILTGDVIFNNTSEVQSHLIDQVLDITIGSEDDVLYCYVEEENKKIEFATGYYNNDGSFSMAWNDFSNGDDYSLVDGNFTGFIMNSGILVLDESVTSINKAYMMDNSSLIVVIPNTVTSIASNAFVSGQTIYYSGPAVNDGNNWGAGEVKPYDEAQELGLIPN